MRKIFTVSALVIVPALLILSWFYPGFWWAFIVVGPLVALGIYDMVQKRHTILRNFPIIGHFRYMLESISPEIRQYFIETNSNGAPFSRLQRNYVYKRAKSTLETHPFGTELDVYCAGYYWMAHSMYPKEEMKEAPRIRFGGKECQQPYDASMFNVSAMSFGSLGMNAVSALSRGAKIGGFYVNTGEGGVSPYHLKEGGDLVWQIGTAYFGCRTPDGKFSDDAFHKRAVHPNVKMIEIKLSQGAKPGLGGLLPAHKNTPEIAAIRGLEPNKMIHSPPAHHAFSNAEGLLHFVRKLRRLSGGKPVGFKLCIGSRQEFIDICKAMVSTGIYPDFITIDGGEGGTGAAPLEFSDSVGMPLNDALIFVCDTLNGYGLRKELKVIASCKVVTGFDIVKAMCIGADACNGARSMLFAIGCIQALRCDTNDCPTGITTQRKDLQKGLVVGDKAVRLANYHEEVVKSAMSLLTAAGLDDLKQLNRSYIYKRVDQYNSFPLNHLFPPVEYGSYLRGKTPVEAKGEDSRHNKRGQPRPRKRPVHPQNMNGYPKDGPNKKVNIP